MIINNLNTQKEVAIEVAIGDDWLQLKLIDLQPIYTCNTTDYIWLQLIAIEITKMCIITLLVEGDIHYPFLSSWRRSYVFLILCRKHLILYCLISVYFYCG